MSFTLCRGGNCASRETCLNYHLGYGAGVVPDSMYRTVDRLCGTIEQPELIRENTPRTAHGRLSEEVHNKAVPG